MAPVDKAKQDAEAAARLEGGHDPAANAAAMNVIDDGARAAPDGGAPQRQQAQQQQEPVPAANGRSLADQKRADIVGRFRQQRTDETADAADDVVEFTRSGMPPEFTQPVVTQEAAGDEAIEGAGEAGAETGAEGAVQEQPAAKAAPVFKVKVHGQEIELTQEELIANAQIALASENLLDTAKSRLKDVDALLSSTREKVGQVRSPGAHHAQALADQPEHGSEAAQVDANHDDPMAKLLEAMSYGDPAEARPLLQQTIAEEAGKQVATILQNNRLKDEGARSAKVLADFKKANPELAADPMAQAAIERKVLDLQIEDLNALGIDPNQIPTPHGQPPTPGDIALAHRWYRAEGFNVRTPQVMLETATSEFLTWKNGQKQQQQQQQAEPAQKPAAVAVTVDRTVRKQAIPQQPARTASPRPAEQQQAPQPRDRSAIVQGMMNDRNKPRGRAVTG